MESKGMAEQCLCPSSVPGAYDVLCRAAGSPGLSIVRSDADPVYRLRVALAVLAAAVWLAHYAQKLLQSGLCWSGPVPAPTSNYPLKIGRRLAALNSRCRTLD